MRRLARPTGGLWEHPDFLRLWTGQSISELAVTLAGALQVDHDARLILQIPVLSVSQGQPREGAV